MNLISFLRPVIIVVTFALILSVSVSIVQATLLDSDNIIDPPILIDEVTDVPTNSQQQAFAERQRVLLTQPVTCSNAIVPAGETVNSYLIFFNTRFSSPEVDADRVWEFEEEVLCIMKERSGLLQSTTDPLFGAPGTTYPGPFTGRGLETDGSDSLSINGTSVTITMSAEPTGDWVRVLTRSTTETDSQPPVVFCEAGINPVGKTPGQKGNGNPAHKFVTLIGADETDGIVEIYLSDPASETVFGPYTPGTTAKITTAKGAPVDESTGTGDIDLELKVNGDLIISATDAAGNTGEAACDV